MDEIKRKVYLDLFAAPSTLLPLVGGATALIGSWAIGGQELMTFAGIAGILSGIGIFATRIIFGLEKITKDAFEYSRLKEHEKLKATLQDLYDRLVADDDPRTEKLLVRLCNVYNKINMDTSQRRIPSSAGDVVDSIHQMFHVCVDYLNHSHQLWEQSTKMHGESLKVLKDQRQELIEEVEKSVTFLENTIGQLNVLPSTRTRQSLSQMRAELDESIRVARATEERIAHLDGKSHTIEAPETE
jgi:hypothetical protein